MPNTIDSTGFDKVRFQDLRAEKAQEYKDTFDNQNLKTDVRSGVGQEVSLSTKAEDDLASTFQTLLSVFNPTISSGSTSKQPSANYEQEAPRCCWLNC